MSFLKSGAIAAALFGAAAFTPLAHSALLFDAGEGCDTPFVAGDAEALCGADGSGDFFVEANAFTDFDVFGDTEQLAAFSVTNTGGSKVVFFDVEFNGETIADTADDIASSSVDLRVTDGSGTVVVDTFSEAFGDGDFYDRDLSFSVYLATGASALIELGASSYAEVFGGTFAEAFARADVFLDRVEVPAPATLSLAFLALGLLARRRAA